MRTPSIILLLFFIISSCKNVSESSLELNVDPLTKAYKKNNVKYYLRIDAGKDTIYSLDSVCINKQGFITFEKTKIGWFNETRNEYDSLNRIIKSEHHSDIHYKSKVEYQLNEKSGNLISYIFSFNGSTKSFNSRPSAIMYHKFRNGRLEEEILVDAQTKDTLKRNRYIYKSNNRISKILKHNLVDGYKKSTEYKYRKNNTLSEIIDNEEVKYISEKSGLIDSIKQTYPNERITYKYFYREPNRFSK